MAPAPLPGLEGESILYDSQALTATSGTAVMVPGITDKSHPASPCRAPHPVPIYSHLVLVHAGAMRLEQGVAPPRQTQVSRVPLRHSLAPQNHLSHSPSKPVPLALGLHHRALTITGLVPISHPLWQPQPTGCSPCLSHL